MEPVTSYTLPSHLFSATGSVTHRPRRLTNREIRERREPAIDIMSEYQLKCLRRENRVVVVAFISVWSKDSKVLVPYILELARQFKGRVCFAKIDIDLFVDIAGHHRVRLPPSFVFYKDGETDRSLLYRPTPDDLKAAVEKLL
ncbi:hypothetical protein IWQ60_010372 [Tieghemiomyces parasiticus]|uniref:Thioredoxin domain-containing protein n=1 Tax=Tieghemiomyces parasiticus TaxID=78921 RepID=A0A9W7ZJZ5_9FUNG|nr:hypothetical protein IWQ60_010372 [Tieghemiomyces parasiticus]